MARLRGTLNKRDDTDRGWSVEGRIPWADFFRAGGRPEPGEQWRFALGRWNNDRGQPVELTTNAPIREKKLSTALHQIEDYLPVTFVGPDATTLGELIADRDGADPAERAIARERSGQLWEMLDRLPERHRLVLVWRYGLGEQRARSHAEIGSSLGVGEERSRQIEREALQRLRSIAPAFRLAA